jgi:hypothetical protein
MATRIISARYYSMDPLVHRVVLLNAGLMLFIAVLFHLGPALNNLSNIIRFVLSFP